MCGRYVIARAAGDLLAGVELEESCADYNVAPTHTVPIIVDHAQEDGTWSRAIHPARWGLLPRWAKDETFSSRTFNARSETAATKPAFRHAARAQHCAIPANGYYEWLRTEVPGRKTPEKTPYYVHPPAEEQSIYFAGLYDWWRIPSGPDEGQWLLSATILTMDSPSAEEADARNSETLRQLSRLHDRLPIPLETTGDPQDGLSTWLRTAAEGAEAAQRAIDAVRERAYDVAAGWRLREVGPAVGSPRNNGPELLEPAGQRRLL